MSYYDITTLLSNITNIGILSSIVIHIGFNIYHFIQHNIPNSTESTTVIINKNERHAFFASLILKIKTLSSNYFQSKQPNLTLQRRNSTSNPTEYLNLCKQTITLNEESNAHAIETILNSLPNSITIETFNNQLQSIPPQQLQQELVKQFQPTENESKIDINTLKEAKLYLYTITINLHKELLSQLESSQDNIDEIEYNKNKGFLLMLNHIKVNDMLYNKYGIEEDRLEMLCLQKGLNNTNKEFQQKEEELKQLTITNNNK